MDTYYLDYTCTISMTTMVTGWQWDYNLYKPSDFKSQDISLKSFSTSTAVKQQKVWKLLKCGKKSETWYIDNLRYVF